MEQPDSKLEQGREAFSQGEWGKTYNLLASIDNESPLQPSDLELLATAAYMTGRDADCIDFWSRAHQEYIRADDLKKAAECAFWTGLILFNMGESARGNGWNNRSKSLLEDYSQPCPETGLVLIPEALQHLRSGDTDTAAEIFIKAGKTGKQFNNPDLITFSRLGLGQTRVLEESFSEGTKLLDEAMVSVIAEKTSPIVTGIVYCNVLSICRKICDMHRAREWTTAMSRWCDSQSELVPYRAQCLVRRAEIMQLQGDWEDAMHEIEKAHKLAGKSIPPAEGEAFYCQGELFRLQGNFSKAETSYRRANQMGRKPQPGLALLKLALDQPLAAIEAIRQAEQDNRDPGIRSAILPAFIEIMLKTDQLQDAQNAANELSGLAENLDTRYLRAIAKRAKGHVLLEENKPRKALEKLNQTWSTLKQEGAIYESARTRVLIGLAYRALDAPETAELELDAASWIFRQLGAAHDLSRTEILTRNAGSEKTHGLTPRELEVLCNLATGKTNKQIASELFISERTVDRHVSNILGKLNLPTRSAATAYAYKHNLL